MKLRKIGNSQGTTFSREMLNKAGFQDGQELNVLVTPGEIKIVPAMVSGVTVSFTSAEAKALAAGKLDCESGEAALTKVRRMIGAGWRKSWFLRSDVYFRESSSGVAQLSCSLPRPTRPLH